MKVSNKLSNDIKFSSFISMVLIVMIHAYNLPTHYQHINNSTFWLENIISNGFARLAVPIFFITSGFFFFNNKKITYPSFFKHQLFKRLKTIGIPFLIWSFLGFLSFCLLQLIPQIKPYYNNFLIKDLTLTLFFEKWLIFPIPFQLWFLQILLICALLAPLIWKLLSVNNMKYFFIFALTIMWFLWGGYNGIKEYFFEGILFFTLGTILTIEKLWLRTNSKYLIISLGVFTFILIIIKTQLLINGEINTSYLTGKVSILTGIPVYWHIIKKINEIISSSLKFLNYSFWLFLTHEPLLTFVKKIIFMVMPNSYNASQLIVYFTAPIITIISTISIGMFISAKIPRVYSFLTGGR